MYSKPLAHVGSRFKSKYGEFCTVVEYKNSREVYVIFDGYEDKVRKLRASNLKDSSFKNLYRPNIEGVGYLGDGKYSPYNKGVVSKSYRAWKNGLTRCYNDKIHIKRPTYKDCIFCDDWLEYQKFAEWYENHESYGLGYELDKDLMVRGNRVYSPETCTMLPYEINQVITMSRIGEFPQGVWKNGNGFCCAITYACNDKRTYLGYYKTIEEASAAYVKAKEDYIHSLAEKWHGKIEERAYQALKSWTVYP